MNKQPLPGKNVGHIMIYLAWIVFLGLLTLVFDNYLQQQSNPNQDVASEWVDKQYLEVTLKQNRQGHYVTTGKINQHPVTFILDTGATHISIPLPIAERLGLKKGFATPTMTANGTIEVYNTRLQSVSIGDITLHNIRAGINPYMQAQEILLGMSFLKHLEIIQRDGQLTIRQHATTF